MSSVAKEADAHGTHPSFPLRKPGQKLRSLQVHRTGLATLVILKLVGEALLFLERAHSGCFDSTDVDEGIVASSVIRDEAVAFVVVEEFHCADGHI